MVISHKFWCSTAGRLRAALLALVAIMGLIVVPTFSRLHAAGDDEGIAAEARRAPAKDESSVEMGKEAERMRDANAKTVRKFHEVLDELLAEFGYDVKSGQMQGLKNLAIRRTEVSSNLPKTYKKYLELLVAERIRENSLIRLISCVPCSTKTSELIEGKLHIISPASNVGYLDATAAQLGIENFVDVVLIYHSTHMVLAIEVFNSKTKEMVWARTFNSETIKSRFQKLAIDYSQVAKSRPGEEYVPEYRLLLGVGGASIPNVTGKSDDSSFFNLQIRGTERFNRRRTEFGVLFSILMQTSTFSKDYPTTGTGDATADPAADESAGKELKPFSAGVMIFPVYAHNFIGPIESYAETRHGFHVGLGPLIAAGYLAVAARGGWDIYFGRRFALSAALVYVTGANVIANGEVVKVKGGVGGDLSVAYNF